MTKFDLTDVWDILQAPEPAMEGFSAVLSNFLSQVQAYCRREIALPQRIRTLRYARTELASAEVWLSAGAEISPPW